MNLDVPTPPLPDCLDSWLLSLATPLRQSTEGARAHVSCLQQVFTDGTLNVKVETRSSVLAISEKSCCAKIAAKSNVSQGFEPQAQYPCQCQCSPAVLWGIPLSVFTNMLACNSLHTVSLRSMYNEFAIGVIYDFAFPPVHTPNCSSLDEASLVQSDETLFLIELPHQLLLASPSLAVEEQPQSFDNNHPTVEATEMQCCANNCRAEQMVRSNSCL